MGEASSGPGGRGCWRAPRLGACRLSVAIHGPLGVVCAGSFCFPWMADEQQHVGQRSQHSDLLVELQAVSDGCEQWCLAHPGWAALLPRVPFPDVVLRVHSVGVLV